MILTAHQPVYLPWLGMFHKIYLSEQFCLFDIAQYQTKDYNNRNKIKISTGDVWLTVPVESSDHFQKRVCDIKIIDDGWRRKHCKSIQLNYSKAPYFKDYFDRLCAIIQKGHTRLSDLNLEMLRFLMSALGSDRPICKASDYNFVGAKSDLVLDMCVRLGASTYIFGALGRDYANVASFEERGIKVVFQDYVHPRYRQLHGQFKPFMSVIDLLFNEGPKSLEILLKGNIASVDGA